MLYKIKTARLLTATALMLSVLLISCTDYLDEKPDKKMVIVSSLRDLQGLLDNYSWVNKGFGSGEAASDNYFINPADFANLADDMKNLYIWNKELVFSSTAAANPWSYTYDNVYRANTVLYYLDKINRDANDDAQWKNVKGQALFLRAKSFLYAASVWAPAFDKESAERQLGVPLRLNPDFNEPSIRSSLLQTYNRIIQDLKEAIPLLPATPVSVTRSAKPSAYALLARTYLFMGQYDSCYKYADLSLQLGSGLFDFNNLNTASAYPFGNILFEDNPEVIYYSILARPALLSQSRAKIDSSLYSTYAEDDLRKVAFFKTNADGTVAFRGSYLGSALFDGLSNREVYLMKAECAARLGRVEEGMDLLNTLLLKRWKTGTFVPLNASDVNTAVQQILLERRKELVMTDVRWMDIKRLNKEGAGIILHRVLNGDTYTLPPNDPRYAMAIPEDVISITGIPQNPR